MSERDLPRLDSVRVPEQFRAMFLKAQEQVGKYFQDRAHDPHRGTISISGERYVLVRAASLSTEFFDLVASLHHNLTKDEAPALVHFGKDKTENWLLVRLNNDQQQQDPQDGPQ